MEMHNLFLEETQGSFSEVTKLLLLSSHGDPSLDSKARTTTGTRYSLKFYSQEIDTLESRLLASSSRMASEASRERTRKRGAPWHSRFLSRAALAWLLATPPKESLLAGYLESFIFLFFFFHQKRLRDYKGSETLSRSQNDKTCDRWSLRHFRYTCSLLVVEWRRLSRFPAKMTLVSDVRTTKYWENVLSYQDHSNWLCHCSLFFIALNAYGRIQDHK